MGPLHPSTTFETKAGENTDPFDALAILGQSRMDDIYTYMPPHRENNRREAPRVPEDHFGFERPSQCDFENNDASARSGTWAPLEITSSSFTPSGPPAFLGASFAPVVYFDVPDCPEGLYSSWNLATLPHDPSITSTPNNDVLFPSSCAPDVSSFESYKRDVGSQAQTQASLKRRKSTSSSPSSLSCSICLKTFTRKKNLDDHKLRHENSRRFACIVTYCLSCFNTKSDLARHVRIVHRTRLL